MPRIRAVMIVAPVLAVLTASLGAQSPEKPATSTAQPTTAAAPAAQQPTAPASPSPAAQPPANQPPGVTPPSGYTIGTDDVLVVIFWQEKEMSGEVVVRPDGRISLPLVNEVQAAGLTPEQLRGSLEDAARKFLQEPNVTVVVKQINSRKVFITGNVGRPGPYPLTGQTTVLQLIAMAGGLQEYADREHIVIIRNENSKPTSYRFNYKEVTQQKKLGQNLELKAGDTVLVP